jgi:hypothetical protein
MNRKEALKDIFIRRLDKDQLKEKWGPDYGKAQAVGLAGFALIVALFSVPFMLWNFGYFDQPYHRSPTADEVRMKRYYDQCMQEEKKRGRWSPSAADNWCDGVAKNKLQAYKDSLFNAQNLKRLNSTWEDYGQ